MAKWTNNLALPDPFVRFVESQQPREGLSVTSLIGPAWQRSLINKHRADIVQDVSDSVWALFGTAVHSLLERYSSESELVEERITIQIDGHTITGQPDILAIDSGILSDWKVCSAWALVLGDKPDWEAQLNLYAYGLRQAGKTVSQIQNVCFIRDWSRNKAKAGDGYPQSMVVTVEHELWSDADCEVFLRARLAEHHNPTPCSPDERWARPTTFAVMAEGQVRAKRVLETREAAEAWAAENKGKLSVVERPGECVRCESYCPVAQFCEARHG